MKRLRLRVTGRVQGVNFRYLAREEAARLGLSGWIRNRDDGDVEAVVEGDLDAVERFAAWCARGPRLASVAGVERTELGGSARYRGFAVTDEPLE